MKILEWADKHRIGIFFGLIVVIFVMFVALSGCITNPDTGEKEIDPNKLKETAEQVSEILPYPFNVLLAAGGGLLATGITGYRKVKKVQKQADGKESDHISTIMAVNDLIGKGLLDINKPEVKQAFRDAQTLDTKQLVRDFKRGIVGQT